MILIVLVCWPSSFQSCSPHLSLYWWSVLPSPSAKFPPLLWVCSGLYVNRFLSCLYFKNLLKSFPSSNSCPPLAFYCSELIPFLSFYWCLWPEGVKYVTVLTALLTEVHFQEKHVGIQCPFSLHHFKVFCFLWTYLTL